MDNLFSLYPMWVIGKSLKFVPPESRASAEKIPGGEGNGKNKTEK